MNNGNNLWVGGGLVLYTHSALHWMFYCLMSSALHFLLDVNQPEEVYRAEVLRRSAAVQDVKKQN